MTLHEVIDAKGSGLLESRPSRDRCNRGGETSGRCRDNPPPPQKGPAHKSKTPDEACPCSPGVLSLWVSRRTGVRQAELYCQMVNVAFQRRARHLRFRDHSPRMDEG